MQPTSPTNTSHGNQAKEQSQEQADFDDSSEERQSNTFVEAIKYLFDLFDYGVIYPPERTFLGFQKARFKKLRKNFIDTFKPYKSGSSYILRDFFIPFYHLLTSLVVLVGLVYSPCKLLFDFVRSAIGAGSFSTFKKEMQDSLLKNGADFAHDATYFLQAVLAVAAAPLIWFLRMPLRGILSLALGRPTLISSLKPEALAIESLVNKRDKSFKECSDIHTKMSAINDKLNKSFDKCSAKGQNLGVTKRVLDQSYSDYAAYREDALKKTQNYNANPYLDDDEELKAATEADRLASLSALHFVSIFTKHSVQEYIDIKKNPLDLNSEHEASESNLSPH